MSAYFADFAWLPHGWVAQARWDTMAEGADAGCLGVVAEDAEPDGAERVGRFVLPGMPNLHSHAFQRAMAGLAERQTRPEDSFWTWREVMYSFASRIGPDALKAIAAQLYVEMLKAGYTSVCEFHYLHHQPGGQPYVDPAAMSLALIEAAEEAGIGLTLLPTLYMTAGFDGRPLLERQRRFGQTIDAYLALLQRLHALENPGLRIGASLHSLRAVPADAMASVLQQFPAIDPGMPIHIHIAEQLGEVQDCLNLRNARPVEWLLDHAAIDRHWCLVHATHMTADESRRLATTGAVVALCPTTEANLGDGLFPLNTYLAAEGAFGIGSDSHISVSPIEELRWLEYGQRLTTRRRNISVQEDSTSVGETLFGNVLFGGGLASGRAIGALEGAGRDGGTPGARADLLVLDESAPLLAARDCDSLLDTLIFSGNSNLVRDVMVGGKWVVRAGRHVREESIAARFRRVAEQLAASP